MLVNDRQDTSWCSKLCCVSQTVNPESDSVGTSKDWPLLKSCTYQSIYIASTQFNFRQQKKLFFYVLKYWQKQTKIVKNFMVMCSKNSILVALSVINGNLHRLQSCISCVICCSIECHAFNKLNLSMCGIVLLLYCLLGTVDDSGVWVKKKK